MKKIIVTITTVITMVTGMICPATQIKAEAARVEDSRVIYQVCDLVAEAKYYASRDDYRSVMSVDGGAVCVLYHGRLESGGIKHGRMLYADVAKCYLEEFLDHYHVEVPEN